MQNLSLSRIFSLLQKNTKIIALFAAGGLIVGVLYAFTVFKPMYKSTTKLLMRNLRPNTYVSDLGTGETFSTLMANGNPALTQIQIITSNSLAKRVWDRIRTKYSFQDPEIQGIAMMKGAISVENPVGTDIIEISAKWKDPKIAKDIAEAYKEEYILINLDKSKRSIMQSKHSIDTQLANAEKNLALVREQLKAFREAYGTVDISTEATSSISQLADLENRYSDIMSTANAAAGRANAIASKLGIDWNTAMKSVAIGHNDTITELQSKLGAAKEEYAGLASKYTSSHPALKAVAARIAGLNAELANQIKQTIGENSIDTGNTGETATEDSTNQATVPVVSSPQSPTGMVITDPVRTGLVEELAANEAAYRGSLNQASILAGHMNRLKNKIASIPIKQQKLAELTQSEANWMAIVDTLKAKQVEATIKEAEVVSSITVLDNPVIPLHPAFPGRTHVAILFGILGAMIGFIGVITNYILMDVIEDSEELEESLKAPVLGVVPWLSKELYDESDSLLAVDNNSSYLALAYQKIVTNMGIKGYNSNVKSLVISSSEYTKTRSTMLMNIAVGLNKAGSSVIVLDADLRTPSIHQEFGIPLDEKFSLPQLINQMTHELNMSGDFSWTNIQKYIQEIPGNQRLHIITSSNNVPEPYEFLNTHALPALIRKLKEHYDWVLIDSPPALAVPDAVTLGSYSDGVVLVAGLDTRRNHINKIHKLFSDNHIPIFGVIGREVLSKDALSSNQYLKQIIARMIPDESDIYVEKH